MSLVLDRVEPWQLDAGALATAYARGQLSPEDVFDSVQARMRAVQPVLNPLVHWDEAGARAAARASGRRWRAGARCLCSMVCR